jgi:peptidoglycan/xylan/chitin deacetylase (PgdA/CDA1 family)
MLDAAGVRGTFFTTGEVARRYPSAVRAIVADGHELACHGDTHRDFTTLDAAASAKEIAAASSSLREFGQVTSFRAPYLRFPARSLPLLQQHGYRIDSSEGRHKRFGAAVHRVGELLPVPASVTSSTRDGLSRCATRLARLETRSCLRASVGVRRLRRAPIRWDCDSAPGRRVMRALGAAVSRQARRDLWPHAGL